eukprot:scaffold12360_cov109-Isochrysis_galbana.AAC.7
MEGDQYLPKLSPPLPSLSRQTWSIFARITRVVTPTLPLHTHNSPSPPPAPPQCGAATLRAHRASGRAHAGAPAGVSREQERRMRHGEAMAQRAGGLGRILGYVVARYSPRHARMAHGMRHTMSAAMATA